MNGLRVFVSESVTRGHPDKLCDQISDAIVDQCLLMDRLARIDVECTVSAGIVFVAVHSNTDAEIDIVATVRDVVASAGYRSGEFNAQDCSVLTSLNKVVLLRRTPRPEEDLTDAEVALIPAQQQVTLFGYANTQTRNLMPLPIVLAHALARRLDTERETGGLPGIHPDGKSQVAIELTGTRVARIHSVGLLVSGRAGAMTDKELRTRLLKRVIEPCCEEASMPLDADARIFVNPDGPLHEGGPAVHAGLTGRKTSVDTYGEYARHSGAALSGKDPVRIDRLGAYAARHLARNVVAAELAGECEVQLSYSVGLAEPISIHVNTFGSAVLPDAVLLSRIRDRVDLRPAGILRRFRMREAIALQPAGFFRQLASYGQVGRDDLSLPWERNDLVELLCD